MCQACRCRRRCLLPANSATWSGYRLPTPQPPRAAPPTKAPSRSPQAVAAPFGAYGLTQVSDGRWALPRYDPRPPCRGHNPTSRRPRPAARDLTSLLRRGWDSGARLAAIPLTCIATRRDRCRTRIGDHDVLRIMPRAGWVKPHRDERLPDHVSLGRRRAPSRRSWWTSWWPR